ncbi:MAG: hypothetical protein AABY00_00680 [Nanoarchaeota archaeon]
MGGEHTFYPGGQYPLDVGGRITSDYSTGYTAAAGSFGATTDPRTSNQLKAVSDKISTGVKAIEITAIQMEALDYIPKQHLDEINRLRKMAGVDLTFHGPLVEPTGITKQGWDESQRVESEKKMWSAVDRAHRVDPDGNIVVTFHSGVAGLQPETKIIDEKEKDPKKREKTMTIMVVDEQSGNFSSIPLTEKRYFPGEEREPGDAKGIKKELQKVNKEEWIKKLQQLNYHAYQGKEIVQRALNSKEGISEEEKEITKKPETLLSYYQNYGDEKVQKEIDSFNPIYAKAVHNKIQEIAHGDIYLRDSYNELKNLFNQAYGTAEKNAMSNDIERREKAEADLKKLNGFKEEMSKVVNNIENAQEIDKFGKEIIRGVNVLRSLNPPETRKPLLEFMRDKASDTFSNVAFNAYKEFAHNKPKNTAPIISIENPPAGTAAFDRAEDLRDLIEDSQKKFTQRAVKELGLSESQAKEQSEKIIGATWDVGHINMIRKFGYSEKDTIKQAETIAKHVKHVHLSDNFGLEHTELPMGMGNVKTKEILSLHENFKKAKKIIETGGWFKDFKQTPLRETLAAFGSPLYANQMAPAWNQAAFASSGYFSGYGFNPDIHHSIYGAGFSGLPVELGGQIQGRSRVSGTPME